MLLLAGCSSEQTQEDLGVKLLAEAHVAVMDRLKDPGSAEFDDSQAGILVSEGLVCNGQVNAKNSFGGYTGKKLYWYSRSMGVATQDDDYSRVAMITDLCIAALARRNSR